MTITAAACAACPGAVDMFDDRHPQDEVLHITAAEWTDFLTAVKAGKLDNVAHLPARPGQRSGQPAVVGPPPGPPR